MRKRLLLILLCCAAIFSNAASAAFDKLCILNKYWLQQTDVSITLAEPKLVQSEREWIQQHLRLVEQTLRQRNVPELNEKQRQLRQKSLDDLNQYWHASAFPVNEKYSYRTPIFIDRHDNFCAVGFLLKASGYETLARRVSRVANTEYLDDMRFQELQQWAAEHGFGMNELAWVQPSYGPHYTSVHVGKGTNGEVRTLYVDSAAGKLYVGGNFTQVDSSIPAPYIAYVTEAGSGFSWQAVGSGGPSAPVNAITSFDGKLFTAGIGGANFWDGTSWHPAGSCDGKMLALQVFNAGLYAAGSFSDASGTTGNFAHWNGSDWDLLPGIDGQVNTMAVHGAELILGGKFSLSGMAANAVSWTAAGSFFAFNQALENEVLDFEIYHDTVYAACLRDVDDSAKMLMRLKGSGWESAVSGWTMQAFAGPRLSFNTLLADGRALLLGGSFGFKPTIGSYGTNVLSFESYAGQLLTTDGEWIPVDGPVNKIVRFGANLIYGGSMPKYLNITAARIVPSSVPGSMPVSVFVMPNPVRSRGVLRIQAGILTGALRIQNMLGQNIMRQPLHLQQIADVQLPDLTPGNYLLTIESEKGPAARLFTVQ